MPTNRREFIAAASAAVLAARSKSLVAQTPKRPNVLVIFADQLSIDALSAEAGTKFVNTPNLDALRARGMYFSRAYCANPLCVPSRTAMFSGRYPVETGAQSNDKTPLDPVKFPCMALDFRKAGYRTGYFGKWHLLYPEKGNQADVHGFDHMASEVVDANTAEHVNEFMNQPSEAPFFAVASFLNPHNICEWARGQSLDQGSLPPAPPADQCPPLRANHDIMQDEPDIMAIMRESYHNSPLFPVRDFDDTKWRQYEWAYYRLIERVDALIGKVLTHLKEAKLEDNTVVLFTCDHGDCQGAHYFNQKTVLYEEAARVPLMIAYPPRIKPGTSDVLASTGVDFLPTLLDFAGIQPSTLVRGETLLPVATGKTNKITRQYVVTSDHMVQGGPVYGKSPKPQGRMIRTDRFKYIIYSEGKNREALVDLVKDPGEMINLAADPKYTTILKQHRALIKKWAAEVKDPFPYIT